MIVLHETGRLMLNSVLMEWLVWSRHIELNFALPSLHETPSTSNSSTSLSVIFFINRLVKSRERLLITPACEKASLSSSSVSKVEEAEAAPPAQHYWEREREQYMLAADSRCTIRLCWSEIRQASCLKPFSIIFLVLEYIQAPHWCIDVLEYQGKVNWLAYLPVWNVITVSNSAKKKKKKKNSEVSGESPANTSADNFTFNILIILFVGLYFISNE